ncbi:MAG TPA: hypothetical protein VGK30_10870 [Candidatus Binatia bacterium]
MTRISARSTFFLKRVFPVLWFGVLGVVSAAMLAGIAAGSVPRVTVAPPVLMALLGFFLIRKLVWDLADEVYDCGDTLLVRNGGVEDLIPLANVMNVSVTTLTNPPRVELRLAVPSKLGSEVTFSPVVGMRLNPFKKIPLVEDLIVRVDRARRAR